MVRALVLVSGLFIAGCASASRPIVGPEITTVGSDEHQTAAPSEQHLTLHVSNQSFADDPVEITVVIDGVEEVHDRFFVEGQHTWITSELTVGAGTHEVVITSDTGARHTASFDVPPGSERWAVVNYWHEPSDAEGSFSFQVAAEPILFD